MIPFTYKNGDYWAGISSAYLAQYEGTESAALNYTYKGEYTFRNLPQSTLDVFTDEFCAENGITNNNDGTYTVTITPSNAWLLAYQSGKDSYIKFMRNVIDPEYYDNNRYLQSYDYLMAQTTFVLSKLGKKSEAHCDDCRRRMVGERSKSEFQLYGRLWDPRFQVYDYAENGGAIR